MADGHAGGGPTGAYRHTAPARERMPDGSGLLESSYNRQTFYNEAGGLALGLALSSELATKIDGVSVTYYVIMLARGTQPLHIPVDVPDRRRGDMTVCKISGTDESFSPNSRRGVNSSSSRRRVQLVPGATIDPSEIVNNDRHQHLRSLVLQEVVEPGPGDCSVIMHCTADEALAELEDLNCRVLAASDRVGRMTHLETVPEGASLKPKAELIYLLDRAWRIFQLVSFDVNVEGYVVGDELIVTQLRPLPPEFSTWSSHIRLPVEHRPPFHRTRLVAGAFNVRGPVVNCGGLAAVDTPTALVARTSATESWRQPEIVERLQAGMLTVILDHVNGFHLSHSANLLPPHGRMRESFGSISVQRVHRKLVGEHLLVRSDGRVGHLYTSAGPSDAPL